MSTEEALKEEVLAALATDERFALGSKDYEEFAPYVPDALVDAVGDLLDKAFSMRDFLNVEASFLNNLSTSGFLTSLGELQAGMVQNLFAMMAEQLWQVNANYDEFMAQVAMSEADTLRNGDPRLNEDLVVAFEAGTLTWRQLVTSQPSFFVPTS